MLVLRYSTCLRQSIQHRGDCALFLFSCLYVRRFVCKITMFQQKKRKYSNCFAWFSLFTTDGSSQIERSWEEVTIPVPWGEIAGKWYGDRSQQPVLALHGWQDNAGTFDRLVPLLPHSIPILCK